MNLNDLDHFRELDTQDMRAHIDNWPEQLESAWTLGASMPLPGSFKKIDRLLIVGVGGAAISGDLLRVLVADSCPIPISINRDYDLPAHAAGQNTLTVLVCRSHTEETLSALEMAVAHGTQILAITSDEHFAAQAEEVGATVWRFTFAGEDRAALGWKLGLLLALVNRLGLVPDLSAGITESIEILRDRIPVLGVEGRVAKNPAKRLAGQIIGRIPVIYAAGILAPVARRWKTQLNENGKTWAIWEELPEMNHNAVSGISFPSPLRVAVIFLSSLQFDHPRVALRQEFTRELYLQQGIAPDTVKARGHSKLAQMLSAVQFGDYVSYYVAMAYGIDPTPTPTIQQLKEKLSLV